MRTLILMLFPALLAAQQTIDFVVRYWIPQMSTRIRVEVGGFGTDIDGKTDLGFSDTNFPVGDFAWQKGRARVTFSYTPIDFTGDQNVNRTILFRGREYTVGTRVISELEVQQLQLTWAFQFIRAGHGIFRLGPMSAVNGFLLHGALAAPAFNISEKEDLSVGLPTVGLALDIVPNRRIDIYGQVAGMDIGGTGISSGATRV
jgi:hypothetical protein